MKVLISTIFKPEPVLMACHKLSPDKLILLANDEQKGAIALLKDSLGRIIDIKTVKIDTYDIVAIATKCVEIMDLEHKDSEIHVNITGGRKTQSIAVLMASYKRSAFIKKITYYPEEGGVVFLPKLDFALTDAQLEVITAIDKGKYASHAELAEQVNISRAMVYKTIKDLSDRGFIELDKWFVLTDAGKIAKL